MTLRVRLALLIAAAIAVVLLLQGIFSYLSVRQTLYTSLDHDLGAYLGQTLSEYQRQQPRPPQPGSPPRDNPAQPRDNPAPPLDSLGSARLIADGVVIRSWAQFPSGIPLPDSSDLEAGSAAPVSLGAWRVRLERLPRGQSLQAAISEISVRSSLASYQQSVIVTVLLVAAFGAWLAWWLTGPALQPLRVLTQTARRVAQSGDLSLRVPAQQAGGELGDLSQTFNEMLERLTEFLTRETQFTRNASHELRTPLTALTLHLSAYREGLTTPTETLEVVSEEVQRMSQLTAALLILAREGRAEPTKLDLAALASHMALEAGATYTGLTHLELLADPTLLRQTLHNLLENAAKYAPQSAVTVSLVVLPRGGSAHAVLSVRDHGLGLSADALLKATQAFYRAPGVRVAGSGLGLSVVNQIALVHRGHLELVNSVPQGLEVRLWLPMDAEYAQPERAERQPSRDS